jgi:hypothetical protein
VNATLSRNTPPSLDERIIQLLPRVEYRLAESAEEREAIFRLRYTAYLREEAIRPNSDELFTDPVDEAPNCHLVGLHVDGRLASSMRLSVGTAAMPAIPTAQVFPDILDPLTARGQVIIDPTRFVGDRETSKRLPELPYLTVRAAWMAAEHFDADLLLAAVRLEHQPFYQRLLGHEPLCGPRPYPNLAKPVALMGLDFRRMRAGVVARHPCFASTAHERWALFGRAGQPLRPAQVALMAAE